ncbi:MAG: transglutaminase domain-containing protein [Solibacillus sp.]
MAIYFETLQQFKDSGGLKATTITAKQLLPAVVAHMQRMDRTFSLQINGRLPKPMDELLDEVFALCHLQQPFYTQHCASRNMRYKSVSKSRIKIDFTLRYRMTREEEKWVLGEIRRILARITCDDMSVIQKIIAVHDYIIRAYDYEMQTDGSPFTVYTFMHERQGVCMAYALLFEKMMEELNIPCYYVVGKADGESEFGHAWNMVEIDGAWYHVDATWNDLGKKGNHEIRYRYFLRSDEVFKRDHQWNLDHYPPCVSDRFDQLSVLYDVVLYNGKLYGPHPKTAELIVMDVEKLVAKKLLDVRVQYCTVREAMLYFSNFSDGGTLYRYQIETGELEKLAEQKVERITVDEAHLTVTFEAGEPLVFGEEAVVESVQVMEPDITMPLMRFGDSWFGSYEGKAASVMFEAPDGLSLYIKNPVKQLTVDILLHKELDIRMTSARKDAQLTERAQLMIPKSFVTSAEVKDTAGQTIAVVEQKEQLVIPLEGSTKLFINGFAGPS